MKDLIDNTTSSDSNSNLLTYYLVLNNISSIKPIIHQNLNQSLNSNLNNKKFIKNEPQYPESTLNLLLYYITLNNKQETQIQSNNPPQIKLKSESLPIKHQSKISSKLKPTRSFEFFI